MYVNDYLWVKESFRWSVSSVSVVPRFYLRDYLVAGRDGIPTLFSGAWRLNFKRIETLLPLPRENITILCWNLAALSGVLGLFAVTPNNFILWFLSFISFALILWISSQFWFLTPALSLSFFPFVMKTYFQRVSPGSVCQFCLLKARQAYSLLHI